MLVSLCHTCLSKIPLQGFDFGLDEEGRGVTDLFLEDSEGFAGLLLT